MAIYRGNGGSLDGLTESEVILLAISQGGTGSATASGARTNLGLGTAATTDASAYATAAQGALADTAIQAADLGTAAYTDSTDYATAAQGVLADSAVQPGDLATVATTGSYNDLTDLPTAGTGTVTSVALSVPTGLAVSGSPVTTTGTLAVTYDTGYAIPTTAKQTNWDTAYGWGNHASAGYLTSYTETDPVYVASSWYSTTNNSTNWNTAYGWGNHALAGYLTSEAYTGTVTSVAMTVPTGLSVSGTPITSTGTLAVTFTAGYSIPTTTSQGNWDTAYGWGNHASAGYALDNAVVKLTGDQTVAGIKTFSSTIVGSVNGNAGTVTNGVYTTGDQTIAGTKTFSSTITGSISGNAGTVTNGVYTSGSYADPSWITSLAGSKLTGTVVATNGVVTTTSYSDPSWITSLAGSKITGTIDGGVY